MSSRLKVIAAMLLFAVNTAFAQEQAGPPKAQVGQAVHDFGSVSQGTKVQYDFIVRNEGASDLVIQRVVAACGCTAASASPDPIKPNEEGKIHVEFDTSGFSGKKEKTIRVYTNDPENPSQILSVRGLVEPDVSVEPASVVFEEVVHGARPATEFREVIVRVREGSSAKIAGVRSFSKSFAVEELEAAEKVRRLRVSVDPSAPPGEIRERLVINISGARNSSINIPLFAVVKGKLSLKPNQLSFGVIEGDKQLLRTAKLETLGEGTLRVVGVRADNPAVTAEAKAIEEGKSYQIQVRVDPRQVTRDLRAVVEVTTEMPEQETVALNIYGILPPRQ